MSASKGIVLATNVSTLAATSGVFWSGGRAAIVLVATTYPTTCKLQCQGPDGVNSGGTWVDINSTTFSANQITSFDLPAGQYRLNLSGGAVAGLYANLVLVPNS